MTVILTIIASGIVAVGVIGYILIVISFVERLSKLWRREGDELQAEVAKQRSGLERMKLLLAPLRACEARHKYFRGGVDLE
jgi:hypothetical protein